MIPAITVQDLKTLYDQQADFLLLDVREPEELAICQLPQGRNIPLQTLPARFTELPVDKPIVVSCHHGGRSAQAVQFLLSQGFDNIVNLTGGIHDWATVIDPQMPTY